jgi:glycosyltransferase involved in cell wall biosynthesis
MGVRANKISFLPNVVDSTCFCPVPRQTGSSIRILTIGRMEKQKNHRLFLAVLAQLRKVSPLPVLGLIVGEGPDRKSLEALAHDYGLLPDGVKFYGNVADPLPLYQAADIFLLTSDWEGTPNALDALRLADGNRGGRCS